MSNILDSQIFQKLTSHAKKSLLESKHIAVFCASSEVEPSHILWAICLEKGSLGKNILNDIGLDSKIIEKFFSKKAGKKDSKKKEKTGDVISIKFSASTKEALTRAYSTASKFNFPYVGTEHIVYAIMENPDETVRRILSLAKPKPEKEIKPKTGEAFSEEKTASVISAKANIGRDFLSNLSRAFNLPDLGFPGKGPGPEMDASGLEYFSTNLNEQAKENKEAVIGRKKEIERIINTLGRKNKNNPLLIGEPGVGKTAIALGLAKKINSGDVPPNLLGKKVLSLDIALVVAGTSFRGEFEQRIKDIIQEASEDKNVILFIDEIHSIVGAGNVNGSLDAANILKPALSRGEIQCIGATTFHEYKKYIEKDPALERRFQPIEIKEPTIGEAKEILLGSRKSYENFHKIKIADEAIEQAVVLGHRYIPDRFFPDKAFDILDETASRIRNKKQSHDLLKKIKKLESELEKISKSKSSLVESEKYEEALSLRHKEEKVINQISSLKKKQHALELKNQLIIDQSDIAFTISEMAKIPLEKIACFGNDNIATLHKRLSEKIIGQDEAVKAIFETLLRSQSGVSNPEKPIGSFLFLGPTGVGKTLTAKALAQDFFQNKDALIRIDMSEFMERHHVSQLIGAPAGYVGYGEGGKLTEKVRRNPFSLILFDEVEKAHPDVFNILLQILEEGILTDSEGRTVNFKNSIIILTSNLGTDEFAQASKIGFQSEESTKNLHNQFESIKEKTLGSLKKSMKPEILNRLDHVVVFNALGEKEIGEIVKSELKTLKERLNKRNIQINFSSKLADFIAKKSVSIEQGARYVRKNIQNMLENKIAQVLIEKTGDSNNSQKITCTVKKDEIMVS